MEVTIRAVVLLALGGLAWAADVTVNCDGGQTITEALAGLDKDEYHVISISGTCREYVKVEGFKLTLVNWLQNGEIVSPTSPPPDQEDYYSPVLGITSSQVTVWGVRVAGLGQSTPGPRSVVAVGNRSEVHFWACTIEDGVGTGLSVGGDSSVVLAQSTVQNNGGSGITVEQAGLQIGEWWEWVPGRETTIRGNLGSGVEIGAGAVAWAWHPSEPSITENQRDGFSVIMGGTLTLCCGNPDNKAVRVARNGALGLSVYGGATAAIWGGTRIEANRAGGIGAHFNAHLSAGGDNILVGNNLGPGIQADHNSSLGLWGVKVTGNTGPGIIVSTVSTVDFGPGNLVNGNGAEDLRCSPSSVASGGKTGLGKIKCPGFED